MEVKCTFTEMVDVDLLVQNPRNANVHSDEQIKLLAKIMKHQGWRHPIIVSKRSGFICAGHGRLISAKLNGWTNAPVDYQDFDSEAQEYAFLIADNKIAELSETDNSMLASSISELEMQDFDFELLGFTDLSFLTADMVGLDEKEDFLEQEEVKYLIEVQFPNDMEMNDIKDDLLSRGYVVRVK